MDQRGHQERDSAVVVVDVPFREGQDTDRHHRTETESSAMCGMYDGGTIHAALTSDPNHFSHAYGLQARLS